MHLLGLGVAKANLELEVDDFLLEQLASLMIAALQRQLQEGEQIALIRRVCESMLRVIGLTPAQAKKEVAKAEQHPLVSGDIVP